MSILRTENRKKNLILVLRLTRKDILHKMTEKLTIN